MQKLRKLPFFDRRVVQVDSGGAEPPFEKLQLTCSGGGKYLWFGSTDGHVHCLHHNFALRSFQAFEGQVDHIVEFTDAHVLAVGGSGGGGQPGGARVKIFHVNEGAAQLADQIREIKPFGKNAVEKLITCCDATPLCLVLGVEDG